VKKVTIKETQAVNKKLLIREFGSGVVIAIKCVTRKNIELLG
jgi:hypothetical protein